MIILIKIFAFIISIPARLKGMKFGKNSFIGPGYDWLNAHLRGVQVGDNVIIGRNAWIQTSQITESVKKTAKIIIGSNTQIGRHVTISAIEKITIGKYCLLAYNVSILDHDHNVEDVSLSPIKSGLTKGQKILIGDECFIGAHSFILKGVRLGKHCVVGANSVVTKSFLAYSVVSGNPAKILKRLINN